MRPRSLLDLNTFQHQQLPQETSSSVIPGHLQTNTPTDRPYILSGRLKLHNETMGSSHSAMRPGCPDHFSVDDPYNTWHSQMTSAPGSEPSPYHQQPSRTYDPASYFYYTYHNAADDRSKNVIPPYVPADYPPPGKAVGFYGLSNIPPPPPGPPPARPQHTGMPSYVRSAPTGTAPRSPPPLYHHGN